MDKRGIRNEMRRRRRALSPEEHAGLSVAVCEALLARADVRAAMAARKTFAVYLASPEEIDLTVLIERLWAAGCPVAVPAWREGTYELVHYARDTELVAGPMGIREPAADASGVETCEPSVWIVPGLAFTEKGARLGYGGGWYDRFLSGASPMAISLGVAYPFQIVEALPLEGHDVPLTDVVTAMQVQTRLLAVML